MILTVSWTPNSKSILPSDLYLHIITLWGILKSFAKLLLMLFHGNPKYLGITRGYYLIFRTRQQDMLCSDTFSIHC